MNIFFLILTITSILTTTPTFAAAERRLTLHHTQYYADLNEQREEYRNIYKEEPSSKLNSQELRHRIEDGREELEGLRIYHRIIFEEETPENFSIKDFARREKAINSEAKKLLAEYRTISGIDHHLNECQPSIPYLRRDIQQAIKDRESLRRAHYFTFMKDTPQHLSIKDLIGKIKAAQAEAEILQAEHRAAFGEDNDSLIDERSGLPNYPLFEHCRKLIFQKKELIRSIKSKCQSPGNTQ